jgi:hypothetical protein
MELVLDSLEVQQYRAFQNLRVEELGRVNLFVGKNNVGKSSLLEALWIYAHQGNPFVLLNILEGRDEGWTLSRAPSYPDRRDTVQDRVLDIKYLFHGRRDIREQLRPIVIGPANRREEAISIAVRWYTQTDEEAGEASLRQLRLDIGDEASSLAGSIPFIVIERGSDNSQLYRLDQIFDRDFRLRRLRRNEPEGISSQLITASGLSAAEVAQLWDGIALTSLEEEVVKALHIIAPDVSRLSFVGTPERIHTRFPVVKISTLDEPIPLRSMGEGMTRILGLVLTLVNARDGLLLIDEIESGLHYTAQPDIWRLVFLLAHRLNVQVFATTHSWDCIQAFQMAAAQDNNEEAMLIRLEENDGEIRSTVFNEKRLGIATREQIEVR